MTTQSGINLNTCVPGQKLERRDGICVEYMRKSKDSTSDYPHVAGGETYTDDGYFRLSKTEDELDIVKILPLKSPMTTQSGINLNTCVPGQKLRVRYGSIVEYVEPLKEGIHGAYKHLVKDAYQVNNESYTDDGCYWSDKRKSELDIVEILPIEEEPAKPTPELTHSIIDQIDVANPDHVSIIPHKHGITICIKKGLTDISWRHYNS